MASAKKKPYVLLGLVALLAVGIGLVIRAALALPTGPVDVAWDREACAECRMHVGDPRFAAQLQLQDGRVLNFDDPGCLMTWVEREKPEVHAMYFHEVRGKGWLKADEAGFVEVGPTPMGHGLGAVAKSEPGAMDLSQAMNRVRSADGGHAEKELR